MCTNRVSGNLPPNYSQFSNSQGLEEKSNIPNDFFTVGSQQYDVNEFRSNVAKQMIDINRKSNIMDSHISFGNCYGSLLFADCIAEITRQSGFTCDSDGSNYKYDGNNPAESIKILVQIKSLLMTDMQIINLCYIMAFLEVVGDDEFNRIVTQQIMPQHNGIFNLSPHTVLELPCPMYEFFNFDMPSKYLEYSSEYLSRNRILPGDYVIMSYNSTQMLYKHTSPKMAYHLMCVGWNELDQPLFIGASGENTPNIIEEIWGRFRVEVKTRSNEVDRLIMGVHLSQPIQSTSRNNQQHTTIQGGFVNNTSTITEYITDPDTICEVNLDEIIRQYNSNPDIMAQIALSSKTNERMDNAKVMVFKFEDLNLKQNMLDRFIAYGLNKIHYGKNYEKKIYFVHNDPGALHQFLTQSINNEFMYTLDTKKGYCNILNELQSFSNR